MRRLEDKLRAIEGQGYKAYKSLRGEYRFAGFTLLVDHVQGDPFADPSRVRLRLEPAQAGFAATQFEPGARRRALEDFLTRQLAAAIARICKGRRGSGRSGEIQVAPCGQQVLARDAVRVEGTGVEARLGVALPADGRRVLAAEAGAMLLDELPRIAEAALTRAHLDPRQLQRHLDCVEDSVFLREWLGHAGLVAFVADGAVLARRSGIDDRPMEGGAVAFRAPDSLAFEPVLPHAGPIRGMGIAAGVTVIVGGGFHGKSTLLRALQLGVYDHLPGDGRERVVCEPTAVKIRAEDGRAVSGVDISAFVTNLPLGRDTRQFTTGNASGSTSQAANIAEALSCGARTLLIDEDTSATNLMIRDRRMQQLVAPEREPITPLIDRVRELHRRQGISTILVTGGSSAYFDVADRVILMDRYRPEDASERAAALARRDEHPPAAAPFSATLTRGRVLAAAPLPAPARPRPRPPKVQAFGTERLRLGEQQIDLARLEQLVEPGQVLAIGHLIRVWLERRDGRAEGPLLEALRLWLQQVEDQGLEQLSPFPGEPHGGLSMPRLHELYAAVNRLRGLRVAAPGGEERPSQAT